MNISEYAGTLLNIASSLSSLNKHLNALIYAIKAIKILSSYIRKSKNYMISELVMLCMGYYNAGAELEFLNKYSAALKKYEMGLGISKKHLPEGYPISIKLKEAIDNVMENINKEISRSKRIKERNEQSARFIHFHKDIHDGNMLSFVKNHKYHLNRSQIINENSFTTNTLFLAKKIYDSPMQWNPYLIKNVIKQ